MSLTHKLGNFVLSSVMCLLYSIDVKDSQSGMWVTRRDFVNNIRLNSDDMSMSEEIKIIAFKFFKAEEVEGGYYKRVGTAKLDTLRHGWHNLMYLLAYKKLLKYALIKRVNQRQPMVEYQQEY